MLKFFRYFIPIMFFLLFFKYLMFPNYKDKGIYLEYKSYKEYTIHAVWDRGCELMEIALTGDGYYGKVDGDGMTQIPMTGDEKEYLSCSGKYIVYTSSASFYTNKAELELEIGKYKAKKAEDVIKSMKRRYSIE